MSDQSSDRPDASKPRAGSQVQEARRDRLKSALRENLKRRKAQARGRHDATTDGDDSSLAGRGSRLGPIKSP
jgi:hypothetical protein